MKNQLQYLYSISVFVGVLLTAYLMINSEVNARIPLRALQVPVYRTDAAIDPAVQELFQMEQELNRMKRKKATPSSGELSRGDGPGDRLDE